MRNEIKGDYVEMYLPHLYGGRVYQSTKLEDSYDVCPYCARGIHDTIEEYVKLKRGVKDE